MGYLIRWTNISHHTRGNIMSTTMKTSKPKKSTDDTEDTGSGQRAQDLSTTEFSDSRKDVMVNPFQRRDSIPRSPARRKEERGTDELAAVEVIEIGNDSEEGRKSPQTHEWDSRPTKKRKAVDSPRGHSLGRMDTSSAETALQKRIAELAEFCKKNNNVHKEIKKLATELFLISGTCLSEHRKIKTENTELREEVVHLKNIRKPTKTTASIACQTEDVGRAGEQKTNGEVYIDIGRDLWELRGYYPDLRQDLGKEMLCSHEGCGWRSHHHEHKQRGFLCRPKFRYTR